MLQDEAATLDTGEEHIVQVAVPSGATVLKATPVWTDPAGEGLQNDLDLIVSGTSRPGRHGNRPAGATAFDRTNNLEQVMWDHTLSGR